MIYINTYKYIYCEDFIQQQIIVNVLPTVSSEFTKNTMFV